MPKIAYKRVNFYGVLVFVLVLVVMPLSIIASEHQARITVEADNIIDSVSPYVFGLNLATTQLYAEDVDDIAINVNKYKEKLEGIGVTLLRFPPGCAADTYDWKTLNAVRDLPSKSPRYKEPLLYETFNSQANIKSKGGVFSGIELVDGLKRKAAFFDSMDTLEYPVDFDGNIQFDPLLGTISMWVKPNWAGEDGETHMFFDYYIDNNNYMRILKYKNDELRFVFVSDGIWNVARTQESDSFKQGEWYHIAMTWDSSGGKIRGFVNYQLVAESKDTIAPFSSSIDKFFVGHGFGGNAADALIDDFKIYDYIQLTPYKSASISQVVSIAEHIGAELDFVINMESGHPKKSCSFFADHPGTVQEAADLVEYLNANLGENPNGGTDWAQVRASDYESCPLTNLEYKHLCVGRTEPFNVKNFQLGNEQARSNPSDWWGGPPYGYESTLENYTKAATNYMKTALEFSKAMKSVDPNIRLTLMGHGPFVGAGFAGIPKEEEWTNAWWAGTVGTEDIFNYVDTFQTHSYAPYSPRYPDLPVKLGGDGRSLITSYLYMDDLIEKTQLLMPKLKWRVYEWNFLTKGISGTLEHALYMIDILRVYMEHGLDYAALHSSHNGVTGGGLFWLGGGWQEAAPYPAFKLIATHTGDKLLKTNIQSPVFSFFDPYLTNQNVDIAYLTGMSTKDADKLYLTIINKHVLDDIESEIELIDFKPQRNAIVFTLNGPSMESNNDKEENVKVIESTLSDAAPSFSYTFPAHSATILVFTKQSNQPNQPPIANAGPNQTIKDTNNSGSAPVTLNGSASFDADGTITSYVWKEGTTEIATGVSPSVILDVGSHTITLTVVDDNGATNTDTVVITINASLGGDVNGLVIILDMIDSFYATGSPPLLEILDAIDIYYVASEQ